MPSWTSLLYYVWTDRIPTKIWGGVNTFLDLAGWRCSAWAKRETNPGYGACWEIPGRPTDSWGHETPGLVKTKSMKITLLLTPEDESALVHDVLMARMHGPHKVEHNYKWLLLREVAREYPEAFARGLNKAREVWSEEAIERLLDTLGDPPSVYRNIVTRVQSMQPGEKRWWPLEDPDQVTAIVQTLKDAGITTHVSSGRLTVER